MKVIDFKNASCKHCYKCVRSCSVKAIKVKDAQATIMDDHCVLCGTCLEVCPQNAKTFVSDLEKVKAFITMGEKTIVSLAPAYLGIFDYDKPGQVVDALLRLGFSEVRETAEGAAYVTEAYARLLEEGQMKNIISTCCPSVNELVEKYYPELVEYMAPVVSPMIAHGKLIKSMYGPDVKVVFVGPCIAKKQEAEGDDRTTGFVDAVLNFEEIESWLQERDISIRECEGKQPTNPDPKVNRLYPVTSGVISSVLAKKKVDSYKKIFVDGIEDCREVFEDMKKGLIEDCFIEANMCEGGCVKGPAVNKLHISKYKATMVIEEQVEKQDPAYSQLAGNIDISKHFRSERIQDEMPTEEQITRILKATGKYNKTQELNCGACGYPTCRDKAIAVFQGKAEQEMCLPHVYEKARSMSNVVLEATPEIVLIVDSAFQIIEFNKRAEDVFGINKSEAVNKMIFEIMDASDFEQVLEDHLSIKRKKIHLSGLGLVLVENIIYIEEMDAMLAIFQDITDEEAEMERQLQMRMDTVDIAQQVIDKQMTVAQEIAGLLGETTAETKVILTQLRDSMMKEADQTDSRRRKIEWK